jgi:hypothetical protein
MTCRRPRAQAIKCHNAISARCATAITGVVQEEAAQDIADDHYIREHVADLG